MHNNENKKKNEYIIIKRFNYTKKKKLNSSELGKPLNC